MMEEQDYEWAQIYILGWRLADWRNVSSGIVSFWTVENSYILKYNNKNNQQYYILS
jgi:hypothetical protein